MISYIFEYNVVLTGGHDQEEIQVLLAAKQSIGVNELRTTQEHLGLLTFAMNSPS